jgi:hypothetical protein
LALSLGFHVSGGTDPVIENLPHRAQLIFAPMGSARKFSWQTGQKGAGGDIYFPCAVGLRGPHHVFGKPEHHEVRESAKGYQADRDPYP